MKQCHLQAQHNPPPASSLGSLPWSLQLGLRECSPCQSYVCLKLAERVRSVRLPLTRTQPTPELAKPLPRRLVPPEAAEEEGMARPRTRVLLGSALSLSESPRRRLPERRSPLKRKYCRMGAFTLEVSTIARTRVVSPQACIRKLRASHRRGHEDSATRQHQREQPHVAALRCIRLPPTAVKVRALPHAAGSPGNRPRLASRADARVRVRDLPPARGGRERLSRRRRAVVIRMAPERRAPCDVRVPHTRQ